MATRSMIGIMNHRQEIKAIYCHYDGYPENNGAILLQHYQDINKINTLLSLGDIKCLPKNIEIDNTRNQLSKGSHNENNINYYSSRCEYYRESIIRFDSEFSYLWINGKWYCNGLLLTREACGLPQV
ncbi:MAG: hypothetical protein LUF87_01850 [Alistipes sp.]|nr:hypothetical protein [Alistipes sp.]